MKSDTLREKQANPSPQPPEPMEEPCLISCLKLNEMAFPVCSSPSLNTFKATTDHSADMSGLQFPSLHSLHQKRSEVSNWVLAPLFLVSKTPSLIVRTVSVDAKRHLKKCLRRRRRKEEEDEEGEKERRRCTQFTVLIIKQQQQQQQRKQTTSWPQATSQVRSSIVMNIISLLVHRVPNIIY